MDVGAVAGFFRHDVDRSSTVLSVQQAAADHVVARYRAKGIALPADACLVLVKGGTKLVHWHTVEEVDWFNQQREIHCGLQSCGSDQAAITWDLELLAR